MMNIETLYWQTSEREVRGIKITTTQGNFTIAPEQYESVLSELYASTPENLQAYLEMNEFFWHENPLLYIQAKKHFRYPTIQFKSTATQAIEFPAWLLETLAKRWGYTPLITETHVTPKSFSIDGVYIEGAVNTLLTWEQWENLGGRK
jgi:hypothetical protein